MVKGNMDRDTALSILGLSESAQVEEVRDQYRRLRRSGHPDSSHFDGVTRNIALFREAYETLMQRSDPTIIAEQVRKNVVIDNVGFTKMCEELHDFIESLIASGQKKRVTLENLIKQYEISDMVGLGDPLIELLLKDLNDSFLEVLYLQEDSTSLDEKF